MQRQTTELGVTVAICAYTEDRWQRLAETIDAVFRQTTPAGQVILVVDHAPGLFERARGSFPALEVVANHGRRGLSGARNTAVELARGEIVAFCDDDAVPAPNWIETLTEPFEDPSTIGTGGVAVPRWESREPRWMPPAFLWVVGCTYRGVPQTRMEIRNPIGTNMAFRRSVLFRAGGFSEGIGRVGRVPVGCEETEFSIRARSRCGGRIVHVPESRVTHYVTADRATWRYFRRRCWSEGLSKALVRQRVGSQAALASERRYTVETLIPALARDLNEALHGRFRSLLRAGALAAGLAITSIGYASGVLAKGRRGPGASGARLGELGEELP